MKNIHILPTPNPSRLHEYDYLSPMRLSKEPLKWRLGRNIYITNSEEIKEGEYCLTKTNEVIKFKKSYTQGFLYKKIILTTDQDLIKDGVQAIPDEFLEWFVNNPSCECIEIVEQYRKCCRNTDGKNENCIESINCEGWLLGNEYERPYKTNCDKRFEGYKIIIPKEEPKQLTDLEIAIKLEEIQREESKQETLEEAAENYSKITLNKGGLMSDKQVNGFIEGVKWQKEQDKNKYSEEDIEEYAEYCTTHVLTTQIGNPYLSIKDWFKKK